MTTDDYPIYATIHRELKATRKRLACALAENARLRTDITSLLEWEPLHQATLRDNIAIGQALTLAADPMPTQHWGDGARTTDPPLPYEPRERDRYNLEMYFWWLRTTNERAASHSPIGYQVTPAGPRPKPPKPPKRVVDTGQGRN